MSVRKSLKMGFILFALATFMLLIQLSLYLFQSNIASTTDFGGYLYYFVAAFGHAGLFTLIPYLFIYIPLTLCLPFPRFNQGVLIVIYFLLNLLAYINGVVFQLYKFHINGLVIDMVFGENAGQIFVFNAALVFRAILILLVVAGIFAGIIFLGYKFYQKVTARQIKIYLTIWLCCLAGSHLLHAYAAAANQPSIQNVAICLPQFYPLTANSLMMRLGVIDKDDLNNNMKEESFNSGVNYPQRPLELADTTSGKNIIFIVVDSWNSRTFTEETCPNIYNFGKQSQVFSHHLSSSNGTRGSIFGLFFSVSSTYWKEFDIAGIRPLFIKTLSDRGYDIETFPSANLINPPFYRMIFGDFKDIRTETPGDTPFDRDNQLTEDFIGYLDQAPSKGEKPFFAFLFYDLLHAIDIPAPYRNKFTPSWDYANYMALNNDIDPTPFFNLYRNCAWHVDSLIGNVIEKLKSTGLLDQSILVITGDHSQEFNENKKNYWGHGANYSDAQIHVPMVYYDKDITPGRYHHTTTHYDIVPTIMGTTLRVTNPPADYSMGQNLTDTLRPPFHIAGNEENYALITKDLIYEKKHTGRIIVTDSLLNPTDRKINPRTLLDAIHYKNRFMKQD